MKTALKTKANTKRAALEIAQIERIETAVFDLVSGELQTLSPVFFLLDCQFEQEGTEYTLRVTVAHAQDGKPAEQPVTIEDCELLSHALDEPIERVLNTLPGMEAFPYRLEISSPGAFRVLKHARDFAFYQGFAVKIVNAEAPEFEKLQRQKTKKMLLPMDLAPTVAQGVLHGYDASQRTVSLLSQSSETIQNIQLTGHMAACLNPSIDSLNHDHQEDTTP